MSADSRERWRACRVFVLDDRTGVAGTAVFGPQIFELFMDVHPEFDAIYEQMRDEGIPSR